MVVTSRTPSHIDETARLVEAETSQAPATLVLDQNDRASVEQALEEATRRFGPIDIVRTTPVSMTPPRPRSRRRRETWRETFSVNVDGVFRICRAAVPLCAMGARS